MSTIPASDSIRQVLAESYAQGCAIRTLHQYGFNFEAAAQQLTRTPLAVGQFTLQIKEYGRPDDIFYWALDLACNYFNDIPANHRAFSTVIQAGLGELQPG